jgi:MFS transporter, putative metabolite:H+ symporter
LPESPRWLIGKGQLAEAERVVGVIEERIAASGKTLPTPGEPMPLPPASSGDWRELFGPTYRNRTLLIWAIWIAIGFTSWPIQTWLPTIYRTLFHVSLEQALNYAIYTSITQLAAALASIVMIDIAGRRLWFAGGLAIAGIALVALWFIGPTTAAIVFVLTTVTTFCIAGLNFGLYLYTPELYPTRLRAVGCGTALAWARAGGIVSPIVIGWGMQQGGLAEVFLGLGIIAGAAGLATFFFAVETKGRVLESVSP